MKYSYQDLARAIKLPRTYKQRLPLSDGLYAYVPRAVDNRVIDMHVCENMAKASLLGLTVRL